MHDIEIFSYNLDTSEFSELTGVAYEKSIKQRHNGARAYTVELPADASEVTTPFADDVPAVSVGDRKLVVFRDGSPIFHGRIFGREVNGDGTNNRLTITAFEPVMELGYESDERAGRVVRGADVSGGAYTGNFINPKFASPITGADLVLEILTNSQETGAESDPSPGEGPLPIDLTTGTFSSTADLSPENNMSWPVLIGDFLQMLVESDQIDLYWRPIDPAEGLDPYAMVALSVVDEWGTDRTGTVHFDYWTGSKNAKSARYVEDFSPVCNKLYDYLGPRAPAPSFDMNQWTGNITPGSPGTTGLSSAIAASRTRYGGPGGGQNMLIRIFDAYENAARPLFLELWKSETRYRLNPRPLLYLNPKSDAAALFEPWDDYDLGDLIAVNVGGAFGVDLAAAQRVYGFDVEWSRNGVERVTSLVTTADAA